MARVTAAPPLQLLSSMATRELLAELATVSARERGQTVHCEATGGVDAARRVQDGEPLDIVVLADNAIDRLSATGRLLAGSRVDIAKSGIAIAVRAGAVAPDVADEAALKRAVMAARSVGYSTGPSGVYLEQLFGRWGIMSELRARIVVPPPGVPVAALLANGQCELGFQQQSELMNVPGIELLGPLPAAIQQLTTFSGAVAVTSQQPEAARHTLAWMAEPAKRAMKQRYGMDAA